MKAIVYEKYGSPEVLELREIDRPAITDDQVLLQVHASSVNAADWHLVTGKPYLLRAAYGMTRPKRTTPGRDVAGTVAAVGANVSSFSVGDAVYGEVNQGAFAEYAVADPGMISHKPANLDFEQAAAVPLAAMTALQGLRDKAHVKPGQHVLVVGASGGVGTFAVQIAKSMGAEVTAVCSTRNIELVTSIGADHVIDYTAADFTRCGMHFDVVVDVVANRSLSDVRRVLTPKGTYVSVGAAAGDVVGPITWIAKVSLGSLFASQSLVFLSAKQTQADLDALRELVEAGRVSPVIHSTMPLSMVPEAIRLQGEGHAQGKTVISVAGATG